MDAEQLFTNMLGRVYEQIDEKNSGKRVLNIPNPIIETSPTRTYWKNIKRILIAINRPPDHFIKYINTELHTGNWISNSKSDGIVLAGRYNISQLTNIIERYVKQYVVCNICKSTNTLLEKNKELRCYIVSCNKCNSKYSV
jgi:translation initiation factor 2 subunit 2